MKLIFLSLLCASLQNVLLLIHSLLFKMTETPFIFKVDKVEVVTLSIVKSFVFDAEVITLFPPKGTFTLSCLGTSLWVSTRLQAYLSSTSFNEGPSGPKPVCSGDVVPSKVLIGSRRKPHNCNTRTRRPHDRCYTQMAKQSREK